MTELEPIEESEIERLKARLANHLPAAALGELGPSPVPGLYQLSLPGQVAYVSPDGRYLVTGRIIDLETREGLTERVMARQRLSALEAVPEERMIVFDAESDPRHTITTFTDMTDQKCKIKPANDSGESKNVISHSGIYDDQSCKKNGKNQGKPILTYLMN